MCFHAATKARRTMAACTFHTLYYFEEVALLFCKRMYRVAELNDEGNSRACFSETPRPCLKQLVWNTKLEDFCRQAIDLFGATER